MMKRVIWWFCIGVVSLVWSISPAAALLSQALDPEEVWLTVYQGVDRGWVVERMSLFLDEGDNRFVFSGGDLIRSRFFFKPLAEEVRLRTLDTFENGFRITLAAAGKGRYPVMLSFFESGFDWREGYTGILDEKEEILWLHPTVYLSNTNIRQWQNVNLSWLLGSPAFEVDETYALFKEADFLAEPMGEAVAAPLDMKRVAPPVVEQVSEYQVFRLPYRVDFPSRSHLAVFPGTRKLPYTELYRYQDGVTQRILSIQNEETPLAGGTLRLFVGDREPLGQIVLPLVRMQEEVELSLGPSRLVSVERTMTRYRRLKVEWNEDREVIGFLAEREITFLLTNRGEKTVSLELNELLPHDGRISDGEGWRRENGQAIRLVNLDPDEKTKIVLIYEFREVL